MSADTIRLSANTLIASAEAIRVFCEAGGRPLKAFSEPLSHEEECSEKGEHRDDVFSMENRKIRNESFI